MTDVTRLLMQVDQGDPVAAEQLLPLVYQELRRLAARHLGREKAGQTLDATGLVHEAYLRLLGGANPQVWHGRGHFFAAAAEAMRRILVDKARRRKAVKHGGDRARVNLDAVLSLAEMAPATDLLALDEALTRLAQLAPAKAEVVKLRYFAGLSMNQVAEVLQISLATVERYWTYSRSWLYAELSDSDRPEPPAPGKAAGKAATSEDKS
ncbi:MAG TPA: ECF-type sigma factor [Pirellulales bacterium]|jgi:RNA polymerase sigma factor (TIGR02999 family)